MYCVGGLYFTLLKNNYDEHCLLHLYYFCDIAQHNLL